MKKISKIFIVLSIAFTTLFGNASFVFAKDNVTAESSTPNILLSDETFTDYENTETGEYFRWVNPNSKSRVKNFEFSIRYSVDSSSFTIDGTNLKVYINSTRCVYGSGNDAGISKETQKFTVTVYKSSLLFPLANNAVFYGPCGATNASLGGGFTKGDKYWLRVTNNDDIPRGVYLEGSGYIYAS